MPVQELANFRSKYPEYSDMSDVDLADNLARKYPAYTDLPGRVRSETSATTSVPATTPALPVRFQPSESAAEPTTQKNRYDYLAGGSEAKIQNPPGFFSKLASEFAAPYLELGRKAWEGEPITASDRILADLRVLNSPFTAIQRQGAETAQSLGASPQNAETIGDAAAFAVGLIPPVKTAQAIGNAAKARAVAIAEARAQAVRAAREAALNEARIGTVADTLTRSTTAIEAPEAVAHRVRQADMETAFANQLQEEAERNLRQSPRGRDLLAQDLRSRQAIEMPGPVDQRAAAMQTALEAPAELRRSAREAELLRRRLAVEEQRSLRLAPPEPQIPPTPPTPAAEVVPVPRIVESTPANRTGPSIEKPFSGYLSDLKISLDKTLPQDRGELQALMESPLGKRAIVKDARPNSVSLQRAVEMAYEDGYIPEESYAAFKDAVDRSITGERVYSTKSQVFDRVSKAQQTKLDRQAIGSEAERHIQTITDTPADLEFKGKVYNGAVRESDGSLRLKDHPDKVLKRDTDILQVEEKIPFDIPPEEPAAAAAPDHLTAEQVVSKIENQQSPQYFDKEKITKQVEKGGETYVKTEVDPRLLDVPGEKSVKAGVAAPEKGAIVVDAKGKVIDGRHRVVDAKKAGETEIEAYVPAKGSSFEQTPAGQQAIIPGAEGRIVPNMRLRSKRAQTEAPMELERPAMRAGEPELFSTRPQPVPESELLPEEIAARDEMRDLLGQSRLSKGRVSEPGSKYGQPELPETDVQPVRVKTDLFEQPAPRPKASRAPIPSDVMYARRTGVPINNVADVNVGDVVYDGLLERYGQVAAKHKDAVSVVEGKDRWTIGVGNRLQGAEIMGQQGALDLRIGKNGRRVLDILKNERGSLSLGKDVDEAAARVTAEANRYVSKKRLFVGEVAEQSTNTLRKTMGAEGSELADRLLAARNNAELDTGRAIQPLDDAIKKLERGREWINFVDVLEGKARPLNERVADAVRIADSIRRDIARRAGDAELMIKNPLTGEKYPFQPRQNFFPHFFRRELEDIVKDPVGRARIKAQIREKMMQGKRDPTGVIPGLEDWARSDRAPTDREVELALRAMVKASKQRYGHLEIARMLDLGEHVKDPRLLGKYIHDAYRRVNIAEQLGGKLETAENLLTAIGEKYGDDAEAFARTLTERFAGMEGGPDSISRSMMEMARNYEAMTKLGRAVIPNMSQSAQTAVVAGVKNTARALRAAATKEGQDFARRAGVALDQSIREFMHEVSGTTEGPLQRGADKVLRYTGFTSVERMNRVVAANAGKYFAHETFDALQKATGGKAARLEATLKRMNVDVTAALKRGALSETDELKAAQSIVNRTQFKSDPLELPLFWSSPEGRLLTQFKGFSYKAGQLLKNEVIKEIGRGNLAPAARAVTILPFAGYAVKKAQNALRSYARTDDEGIADYIGAVGALGLFADIFRKSALSSAEFVAGPTLSDIGRGMLSATKLVQEGDIVPAAKFAARQIPVAGPTVSALINRESKKTKMLRELGMYDEIKQMERERAQMRGELR